MRSQTGILYLILVLLAASGCSRYNRMLKSTDYVEKQKAAEKYYTKKDYFRSMGLYEQLQDYYGTTAKGEDILYYNAYCNYYLRNYTIGGYLFKTYFETYSNGIHVEESFFMYASCIMLDTYPPELDQTNTYKAIEEFKAFALMFPESKLMGECNKNIDQLRNKLMMKSYRMAKLYFRLQDYKGALVTLNNSLKDYPEMPQREELEFLIVKSNYLLARNSIEEKKKERFENTVDAFRTFIEQFPESRYRKEATQISEHAQDMLKKYTTTN